MMNRADAPGDGPEHDALLASRVVDLERRVLDVETLCEHRLQSAPQRVTIGCPLDQHVRGKAGNPLVTVQTCRSWASATPGWSTIARPTRAGSMSPGARSRKIRAESRIRLHAARR